MEKTIEWVKNHKPHTAAIVIVVVAVIAVSIAAASGAFTQQDKTTTDEQKTADATLKGDSGKAILDKLDGNVSANPNVSDETKENASKADEGVDIDGKPADKPSGGNANASGSNTGNSNSGNTGGSDKPSTPAHQHSWTQHTAQRWVSNMVTVPDYETQTVYGVRFYVPTGTPGQYIAKGPEYWFENGFTRDDLKAIIVNALRNADENGLYNGVDYSSYQNIKRPCRFRSVPIRKTTVTTRTTWTTYIAVRAVPVSSAVPA